MRQAEKECMIMLAVMGLIMLLGVPSIKLYLSIEEEKAHNLQTQNKISEYKSDYSEAALKTESLGYKVVFQNQEISALPSFLEKDEEKNAFAFEIEIDDELKTVFIIQSN